MFRFWSDPTWFWCVGKQTLKHELVKTWQVLMLCFGSHVPTSHEAPWSPIPIMKWIEQEKYSQEICFIWSWWGCCVSKHPHCCDNASLKEICTPHKLFGTSHEFGGPNLKPFVLYFTNGRPIPTIICLFCPCNPKCHLEF